MGRAGRLIFFKKLTSNLLPFCTMLVVAIVSSAVLQYIFEDTDMVRYIVFGLSALIMILGLIFVYNVDEPHKYINPKHLTNNAIALAIIGFLLWKSVVIDYLFTPTVLLPLSLVVLLTLIYDKRFKKSIVNEILKEDIEEDFTFISDDIQSTSNMIAEQMSNQVKDKYKGKFLVKTLNYAKNSTTKMTEFAIGFLTKSKHPKIIFEIIISLDMD
jgi:hypothetical protein